MGHHNYILTISHNIHLNREQRYALYEGQTIEVIGVSLPVWLEGEYTSEPAREVFCRYVLHNGKEEKPINILEDGYEITLPYKSQKPVGKIPDKSWLKLSMNNAIHGYYNKHAEVSCKNLLDPTDNGGKYLMYKEQDKLTYEKQSINVIHYVQISDIGELFNNITEWDNLEA